MSDNLKATLVAVLGLAVGAAGIWLMVGAVQSVPVLEGLGMFGAAMTVGGLGLALVIAWDAIATWWER